MVVVNKKFNIFAPISKDAGNADTGTVDDSTMYISGIANSGLEDLVGDIVTEQALQSIVDQATSINLHYNHDHDKDDIIGTIVESRLTNDGAWIKASIIREHQEWLNSLLEQGIKFGLSISGTCDYEEGSYTDIVDWQLTEISLTDIPCDPATMGTVGISKSFDDILRSIKSNEDMEADNMADEEAKYTTEEDVISLINDAFNEKKEETLETIRDELNKEYEARFKAIEEKLDALSEKEPEKEPEENPAPNEEKAEGEEEEEEEEKTFTQADLEKMVADRLDKAVNAKIKNIFDKASKGTDFQYDESKGQQSEDADVENKTYTAREIAEMI